MKSTVMKLCLGASIMAGISAIATTPAVAGSLTRAKVIGTSVFAENDYLKIASDGTNTFIDPSASLSTLLQGNGGDPLSDISDPRGNVELFASSESLSNSDFENYTDVTSLTGQIGGKDITLSSLTLDDWESDLDGDGNNLAEEWFDAALRGNNLTGLIGTQIADNIYDKFIANGGLQRFSDPNISYVNQDEETDNILIGLAGHLNARDMLADVIGQNSIYAALLPSEIRASEIVKVDYNGQITYLYGFQAKKTNLVSLDDNNEFTYSHSGNYELTLLGTPPGPSSSEPQDVPESSTVLGLIAVGGLFTAGRKLRKANC